ncbi:hypothetical protein M422DRAFT_256915 [Sphaerobolus stellatus SS14]|uniref:Uncharacterized protein n=1 Tax=Sphaerobolus stellatus (strain SS14) TaxID=990650 RepID=A0A0C9VR18_SPHS4|nr:hypothetical protein M422DRAFT_256915 [Sphaerobolus stellatus SS14]
MKFKVAYISPAVVAGTNVAKYEGMESFRVELGRANSGITGGSGRIDGECCNKGMEHMACGVNGRTMGGSGGTVIKGAVMKGQNIWSALSAGAGSGSGSYSSGMTQMKTSNTNEFKTGTSKAAAVTLTLTMTAQPGHPYMSYYAEYYLYAAYQGVLAANQAQAQTQAQGSITAKGQATSSTATSQQPSSQAQQS